MTIVPFDPGFAIIPGTGAQALAPEQKPYHQDKPADTSGGLSPPSSVLPDMAPPLPGKTIGGLR